MIERCGTKLLLSSPPPTDTRVIIVSKTWRRKPRGPVVFRRHAHSCAAFSDRTRVEASVRTTIVIEKTMPITVMIAAAMVVRITRAVSAVPLSTRKGTECAPQLLPGPLHRWRRREAISSRFPPMGQPTDWFAAPRAASRPRNRLSRPLSGDRCCAAMFIHSRCSRSEFPDGATASGGVGWVALVPPWRARTIRTRCRRRLSVRSPHLFD